MTRSRLEAPNHTQTPNAFFDVYLRDLGLAELKVTLAIIRQTFGWHKREDRCSYSTLQTLTGLSRPSVAEGVRAGLARGTIRQRKDGQAAYYSLVLDGQVSLLAGVETGKAAEPAGKASQPVEPVKLPDRFGEAAEPVAGKAAEPSKERLETKEKKDPHEAPPVQAATGTDEDDLFEGVCELFPVAVQSVWLRPCRIASVAHGGDRSLVVVEAPADKAGWVRERYASALAEALGELLGRPVSVEVRADLEPPRERRVRRAA